MGELSVPAPVNSFSMLTARSNQPSSPAAGQEKKQSRGLSKAAVAALFIVLAACLGLAFPFITTSPDSVENPVAPAADLPNFHVVHSYLWRGAAPTPAGLRRLKEMGVKTIIDLRVTPAWIQAESHEAQSLGMKYISLPTGHFLPAKVTESTFLDAVTEAASSPEKAPVFVHCAHGSDRTGYLVGLWRVKHDHWSWARAAAEMLKYGFLVHQIRLPFLSK